MTHEEMQEEVIAEWEDEMEGANLHNLYSAGAELFEIMEKYSSKFAAVQMMREVLKKNIFLA